ncbi:MAG: hypothetical protein R3F59_05680 [Myxococcota bacterium]
MTRYIALGLLVAAGCNGDKGTDSGTTGETGTMTMETGTMTDCVGGAYTGPIEIVTADVTCANDVATITATTNGATGGGWYFGQETASDVTAECREPPARQHPGSDLQHRQPVGDPRRQRHGLHAGQLVVLHLRRALQRGRQRHR